jgi:hypothetical protein
MRYATLLPALAMLLVSVPPAEASRPCDDMTVLDWTPRFASAAEKVWVSITVSSSANIAECGLAWTATLNEEPIPFEQRCITGSCNELNLHTWVDPPAGSHTIEWWVWFADGSGRIYRFAFDRITPPPLVAEHTIPLASRTVSRETPRESNVCVPSFCTGRITPPASAQLVAQVDGADLWASARPTRMSVVEPTYLVMGPEPMLLVCPAGCETPVPLVVELRGDWAVTTEVTASGNAACAPVPGGPELCTEPVEGKLVCLRADETGVAACER